MVRPSGVGHGQVFRHNDTMMCNRSHRARCVTALGSLPAGCPIVVSADFIFVTLQLTQAWTSGRPSMGKLYWCWNRMIAST